METKINGFTLAEVLITLGIIGIVAAMTLPTVIGKYRSYVTVTQLKKMYSVVSQAMMRSVPDGDYNNIPVTDGGIAGTMNFFNDYLKTQFNILKSCTNGTQGCWSQKYNKAGAKSGNTYSYAGKDSMSFVTADGYSISVDTWNAEDFETVKTRFGVNVTGKTAMVVIHTDVNGNKKPNILGKDVFVYVLAEKGLIPAGHDMTNNEIETECKTTGNYCFEKIVRNNWILKEDELW